jgi:hypothetical protein
VGCGVLIVNSLCCAEPAILLMVHSIPKYPDMTATLLDFLATAIDSFDEQRRDFARKGVHNSFSVCLGKNVVTYVLGPPFPFVSLSVDCLWLTPLVSFLTDLSPHSLIARHSNPA